jgi:hypothetical protein
MSPLHVRDDGIVHGYQQLVKFRKYPSLINDDEHVGMA